MKSEQYIIFPETPNYHLEGDFITAGDYNEYIHNRYCGRIDIDPTQRAETP